MINPILGQNFYMCLWTINPHEAATEKQTGKTDQNFRGLVTDFKMKQSSTQVHQTVTRFKVTLEKPESGWYYKGDNSFPQIIPAWSTCLWEAEGKPDSFPLWLAQRWEHALPGRRSWQLWQFRTAWQKPASACPSAPLRKDGSHYLW